MKTVFFIWILQIAFMKQHFIVSGEIDQFSQKSPPIPQRAVKDWMNVERDFARLDESFQRDLGEHFETFKRFIEQKTREHHKKFDCKLKSKLDECDGQASLTESEYIMHQSIDLFKGNVNAMLIHNLHVRAHTVFEKTRKMLHEFELIQKSEFSPPAKRRQQEMSIKYR